MSLATSAVIAAPALDLEGFARWMQSWGASKVTVETRMMFAARISEEFPDLRTVSAEQIAAWLGDPSWSTWTRHTYFAHLVSLFEWLSQSGQIEDNPMARLRRPRPGRDAPRPLTNAEVDAALAMATGNTSAWLILGLYAGLRAHEMAKLRGEDVTPESLYVRGKGGKAAWLPTHPLVWELAQSRSRIGWWFPSPRSESEPVKALTVSHAASRLFRSVGIDGSIHRTRHTYATRLLRAGVDIRTVQRLMRHESLQTTQAYLAVDDAGMAAAVALL